MKRKILSVFLCVFLLLPLIPAAAIPAAAATASVVYVKTFEELRKGLEANNNDVVILNGDIDIEIDRKTDDRVHALSSVSNYLIKVSGSHRLDLNGHSFNVSTHFNLESDIGGDPTEPYSSRDPLHKANLYLFYHSEGSSLTIDDSKGGGRIENSSQMPGPWSLKNMDQYYGEPGERDLFFLSKNATLTINGGNFHAGRSKEQYVSEAYGLYWSFGELRQEADFDPLDPTGWNDYGGRFYGDAYSVIPGSIATIHTGSSVTINGGNFFALGRHYDAADYMFYLGSTEISLVINDGYFNSKQCRLLNQTKNVSVYGGEFQYDRYDVFLEVGAAYSHIGSFDNIVTMGYSGNLTKDLPAFQINTTDCKITYDGGTYSSTDAVKKVYFDATFWGTGDYLNSHNIKITPRDKNDAVLSFMSDRSAVDGAIHKYLPGTSVNVYLGGPTNINAPYADPLTTRIHPNDDYGLKNILVSIGGTDATGQKNGMLTVTYDGDHFQYFDLNDYASGYTWTSGTEKGKAVAYTEGWTYSLKIFYLYQYGGYHHYEYLVQAPNTLYFTPTHEIDVQAPWNDGATALESWSTDTLGVSVDSATLYRNGSIVSSVAPGNTIDVAFLLRATEGGNIYSNTTSVLWNGKKQDKILWDKDFTYAMMGASFHLTVPTPADGKQLTETHITVTAPVSGKTLASAKQGSVMIADRKIRDTTSTVMKTEWKSSHGTALPGDVALGATAYTVSVTIDITNKSSFKYTTNTLYYINDEPAKLVSISGDKKTAVLEYTFPATTGNAITTVGVTNILAPEAGEPVEKSIANVVISSPSADSLQIKEIRWVNEKTHATNDLLFQEGNRYSLEITFRANEGSYFPAIDGSYTGTAKINGSAAYSVNYLADNEIKVISKGFTPTVATKAVREIEITNVPTPVVGDRTSTSDLVITSNPGYGAKIVSAVWVNETTVSEKDLTFKSGCEYYLRIIVTATDYHYLPVTIENDYPGTVLIEGTEARRVSVYNNISPVEILIRSDYVVPVELITVPKAYISVPTLTVGGKVPEPVIALGYENQYSIKEYYWRAESLNSSNAFTPKAGEEVRDGYEYLLSVYLTSKHGYVFNKSSEMLTKEGYTPANSTAYYTDDETLYRRFSCIPSSFLWGDANGDGAVDSKDLSLLRKYMASYDYTTGTSTVAVQPGADANGDGTIDSKDLSLLRKYMASYDYTTGTSTVVLGPSK